MKHAKLGNRYLAGTLFLLGAVLILGLPMGGLASRLAGELEVVQVYLPLVTRYLPFMESTGILDLSFGEDGRVVTDLHGTVDSGTAMVLLRDGKLLVGGEVGGTYTVDVAVARYNSDGSLDSTFGTGGWVSTDLYGDDEAAAIAVQSDGKILLACTAVLDFYLVRYTQDGSLDESFGTGGKVRTDFMGSDDEAKAVAVQSDGRIIVAGYATNSSGNYDFALVRYLADGELDPSFGTGGKVTTDLTTQQDQIRGMVIQSDGKIVVVGPAKRIGYLHDFAVARYNLDGTLDTSFGTGGWVFTDFDQNHDFAYAVALQPDGRIVVAGAAIIDGLYDFAVARYNTNGSLDVTFGGDGKVVTDFALGDDYGYAIALQPDGKVIVAGYASNGIDSDFAVTRYYPNGTLDPSFSADGLVMTDLAAWNDKGLAVVLQLDGKIVVAGNAFNGIDTDFALVRYK